jgi:thiol-disulfide isomerase/thioredoxin
MTKPKHRHKSRWPQMLVIVGVALLVAAILALKTNPPVAEETALLPQKQLQNALAASKPTVVFFHSLNCDPCIQMMDVVDQVHPEFAGSVVLVDVNVSDTRNHDLLRAEDIRMIPSLVLYDRFGQRQITYGVMTPGDLRQIMQILAGG